MWKATTTTTTTRQSVKQRLHQYSLKKQRQRPSGGVPRSSRLQRISIQRTVVSNSSHVTLASGLVSSSSLSLSSSSLLSNSYYANDNASSSSSSFGCRWWNGSAVLLLSSGVAATTATAAASATTFCEPDEESNGVALVESSSSSVADTDKNDFPMYDNVPDHDVETDCFLCRTHRQGPCRTQWRNFEYCAKDHPNEDDEGAQRCSVYVTAFQECWMKHLNLYLLIAMTLNQERVQEVEAKFATTDEKSNNNNNNNNTQRPKDLETNFAWQEWMNLLDQEGFLDSCQQVKAVFDQFEKTMAIWKVYESLGEEPFVVNVFCQVPTRRTDGRMLRMIYALDQEGRTIGLADYNQQHEIEKAESEGREPDLEYHRVVVSIIPGVTEAVKIKAVYVVETEQDADEEEQSNTQEELDSAGPSIGGGEKGDVLAESEWIPLPGLDQSLQKTLAY